MFTTTSTNLGGSKYLWEYAQDTRVEAGTYTVRLYTERTKMAKILSLEYKKVFNESINGRWYKNNTGGSSDRNKGVYSFHGSVADVPTGFIGVAAGGNFSLALEKKNDGTTAMYAWGTNTYGQLGLGNKNTAQNMTQVPNFPPTNEKLRSVSAGASATHALALTESGKVYAWGRNHYGQLGLGDRTERYTPASVSSLISF
ncbi:MAG: RCC1 domain-containing protein [Candidatus Ozemobacteraceae bacterium]